MSAAEFEKLQAVRITQLEAQLALSQTKANFYDLYKSEVHRLRQRLSEAYTIIGEQRANELINVQLDNQALEKEAERHDTNS